MLSFFNYKSADGGQGPPTWQMLSGVGKYSLEVWCEVLCERLDVSFVVCTFCLLYPHVFSGIQMEFFSQNGTWQCQWLQNSLGLIASDGLYKNSFGRVSIYIRRQQKIKIGCITVNHNKIYF